MTKCKTVGVNPKYSTKHSAKKSKGNKKDKLSITVDNELHQLDLGIQLNIKPKAIPSLVLAPVSVTNKDGNFKLFPVVMEEDFQRGDREPTFLLPDKYLHNLSNNQLNSKCPSVDTAGHQQEAFAPQHD